MARRVGRSDFKAEAIRLEGKPRSHRIVPLLFVGFCTVALPLAIVVWVCSSLFRMNAGILIQREAAAFASVSGTLTEVRWKAGKHPGVYPKYRFTVDGVEYSGTHYRYIGPLYAHTCRAIGESLQAKVGGAVPVYYDRRDPTISLLDPAPEPEGAIWSRFILSFSYLGIGLVWLVLGSGSAIYKVYRGMIRPQRLRLAETGDVIASG